MNMLSLTIRFAKRGMLMLLSLGLCCACSSDPTIEDNAGDTEERPDVIGGGPSATEDTYWEPTFAAKNADGVLIHYNRLNADECEVARGDYKGDLRIPNTVAYRNKDIKVTGIERLAFARSLDDYYSDYNKGISSITLPENMRHIGEGAFLYAQLKSVDYASYESLCSIRFDDGNSSPLVYTGCQMLIGGKPVTEAIVPSGIDTIPPFAFAYNRQLTSVVLPEGVKHIDDYSFIDCDNLTNLRLPEGLESIGIGAFLNTPLQEITLPASVSAIGEDAFAECLDLVSVRMLSTTPPDCHAEAFRHYNSDNSRIYGTLRVPQGARGMYHSLAPWNRFNSIKEFDAKGIDLTNDNALLYGTWICLKEGHTSEYWTFAENDTWSMWITISDFEGNVRTRQVYTDVPFSYDAGSQWLKLFDSDDYTITYRLRDLSEEEFTTDSYMTFRRQQK